MAAAGESPLTTPATAQPLATLDPQLFMAGRRGDSKELKDLLLLEDDDCVQVVVEVFPRPPPPPLPAAAASSPPPPPFPALDGVTIEGDSLLHVVAACGDGEEFIKCARMIYDRAKRLLVARNARGDTPLVALANADEESAAKALVRTKNKRGETALHHAVRAAAAIMNKSKMDSITRLMYADPELACIPLPPEEGTSPLYLAISLGEMEIARHLFDTSKGKLSYSGPEGRNVLHAAVSRGQGLRMLLKWLKKEAETTVNDTGGGQGDLLWQLTNQRDQQGGMTPLHLAASLGARPWEWFLSGLLSPPVWPGWKSAAVLLDANASTPYLADKEGSYPVHIAAWSGSLGVVKMLLQRCPDCATLRDGKGRTFLHIAAEEERHDVVEYVCGMPHFSLIMNAQDKNGDTALHRAVHVGNVAVSDCLIRNRQVRLDAANKDGMTPLDLSWGMTPSGFHYDLNSRDIIEMSLVFAGAPYGGGRPELLHEKYMAKRDVGKESEKHKDATQVMSIVAVLIATVTFASAFTLPGGYYGADGGSTNNKNYAGTPVLAGSYAFDAFILSDALAFICSCLATFTLVYASVPLVDISIRRRYYSISVRLLKNAGRSFVAAFGLGFYLVLAPVDPAIAVAVSVIIFASLLCGNIKVWQIICVAITARARIGIRLRALRTYARRIFLSVLVHFGSFIIIFGLPAIRKWASWEELNTALEEFTGSLPCMVETEDN